MHHAPPAAALEMDCGAEQTQPAVLREDARAGTECVTRARPPSLVENCSTKIRTGADNHTAHTSLFLFPPTQAVLAVSAATAGCQHRAAMHLSTAVGALQERRARWRTRLLLLLLLRASRLPAAAGRARAAAPLLHAWAPAIRHGSGHSSGRAPLGPHCALTHNKLSPTCCCKRHVLRGALPRRYALMRAERQLSCTNA